MLNDQTGFKGLVEKNCKNKIGQKKIGKKIGKTNYLRSKRIFRQKTG